MSQFLNSKKDSKAEKLELVHIDGWDKASVPSLGGSLYFVIFIDDSSRKVWVYFLKQVGCVRGVSEMAGPSRE